jgi:hypothetical protein
MGAPWKQESMNLPFLLPLRGDVGAPTCSFGSVGDDWPATRTASGWLRVCTSMA